MLEGNGIGDRTGDNGAAELSWVDVVEDAADLLYGEELRAVGGREQAHGWARLGTAQDVEGERNLDAADERANGHLVVAARSWLEFDSRRCHILLLASA